MNTLEARRRLLGRNVYKKTVIGNPAIAQGSLARRYPGIEMQGWTEQESTNGYQLFDASLLSSHSAGGATVTNNGDGSFTISGEGQLTSSFNVEHVLTHEESINLLKVGKIRLKSDVYTSPYIRVGIENYYLTTRKIDANRVIDITQDMLDDPQFTINLRIYANNKDTIIPGTVKPMLYQDGDGTYEPYTGGKPSPSPDYPQEIISAGKYNEGTGKYEYGLRMTGKNLWSRPQPEEWTYSSVQPGYSDFKIYVGKNEKITFSFEKKPQLGSGIYCGIVLTNNGDIEQWLISNVDDSKNTQSATLITTEDFIWVRAYSQGIEALLNNFPDFQIEYGEKRTGQSVTLTSDRPLTKWDKLEKRNGQWGWVYKSAEIVLDGSEDERWSLYSNYNGFLCSGVLNAIYSRTAGMCNQGVVDQGGGTGTPNTIWLSGNTATIYWINNSYFDSGLEDEGLQNLKDHLSQIPVIIWYETAEATFVPLSSSEQEQMNALHTFRPTTVLSNDCECEMTLTYKTKKSLEVTT